MAKNNTQKKNAGAGKPTGESGVPEGFPSQRELIVIAKTEAGLRSAPSTDERVFSSAGADVAPLSKMLKSENITMQPLFGISEDRMMDRTASLAAATGKEVPDLSPYYHIDAPDERLDDLAKRFQKLGTVEAAYVKPLGEPPKRKDNETDVLYDLPPKAEAPPIVTPDFTPRQTDLGAAPAGIDARYAWTVAGGRGFGVKIIDCEWGWRFTHEDLSQNSMLWKQPGMERRTSMMPYTTRGRTFFPQPGKIRSIRRI